MKLIASEFLGMLVEYRICWIAGRFGGGKTSFALATASWLVANGYAKKILSNSPTDLAMTNAENADDSAIVIDEGWQFKQEAVEKYAAFARKINCTLLFPSVWPPHPQFCNFYVQRIFDASCVGLPMWFYRWVLRTRVFNEKGTIALWRPGAIFRYMDTLKVTTGDGGIADAIGRSIAKAEGNAPDTVRRVTRKRIDVARGGTCEGESANALNRAAGSIRESSEGFATSTESLTLALEQLRERLAKMRHR